MSGVNTGICCDEAEIDKGRMGISERLGDGFGSRDESGGNVNDSVCRVETETTGGHQQ